MNTKRKPVKRRRKRELLVPPPIGHISDLITMADSGNDYKNINNSKLQNILPQLKEINRMIGMEELKETLLYQILFYLQELDRETHFLHTAIMGSPGTGKCLGRDTKLLMYDGSIKLVQDVQVGDELMNDKSEPSVVTSVCIGNEDLYLVKQSEGVDYVVNRSHILSVIDQDNNKVDLPLVDVLESTEQFRGFRVPVEFTYRKTTIDPYIMGYILAKHTLYHDEIVFSITSTSILEYFQKSDLDIEDRNQAGLYSFNIRMLDSYPDKLRRVPEEFKVNSFSVLQSFLSGYIDAIGCYKNDHEVVLGFTNEHVFEDVVYICNILNVSNTFTVNCSTLKISDSVLTEKMINLTVDTSMIWSSKSVESMIVTELDISLYEQNGEYYGFELAGNKRFLLSDCTVTHNTTIAKIIGEMYKNMEILSGGSFRIAKREDFVAEYLGQTAIKTKRLLDSCKGGVLFIDEVYALGPGKKDQDSFSKEAIDTITAFLSENPDFCCIIAGYEDEIKNCFFSVNPGLERRFPWVHRVGKYSVDDLVSIFNKLIEEAGWESNVSESVFKEIIKEHRDLFKNYGGDIENFIGKCKMCHSRRIVSLENPEKFIFTIDDLKSGIEMMKKNQLVVRTERYEPPFGMYI
jgi:hypothetical protein